MNSNRWGGNGFYVNIRCGTNTIFPCRHDMILGVESGVNLNQSINQSIVKLLVTVVDEDQAVYLCYLICTLVVGSLTDASVINLQTV